MKPSVIFSAGGTVQASGGVYITRPADEELFRLCMEGAYAYVLTSRQMGKSSLRFAVSERLRREGIHVASIDLTTIGTHADSTEQWYVSLLEKAQEDLRISQVVRWWEMHQHLTPTDRFTRYLLEIALGEVKGDLVVFVDEIDSTLSLPFSADDFFAAIRALFNSRSQIPDARRLSFVLIGSASPGDLIRNSSRTPFNIGYPVTLTDFTEESVQPLAQGFGLVAEESKYLLHRIFDWTAGHPYLTQRLCMAAAQDSTAARKDLDGLVRRFFVVSGDNKDSNLQWVRDMLTERAPDRESVLTVWRDVWRGRNVKDEETSIAKSHLKLTGVVRAENGLLVPRNRIYTMAFDEAWVLQHLPQDLERQRRLARYRRLAFIWGSVALVLAFVGLAMGLLLARARHAEEAATRATAVAVLNFNEVQKQRQRAETTASYAQKQQKRAEAALNEVQKEKRNADLATREAQTQQQRAQLALSEVQKAKQRAEMAASEARARQLAAQSQYSLRVGQLTLASLLGIESLRHFPLLDGRNAVASSLDLTARQIAHLPHKFSVDAIAVSNDGRWLATSTLDDVRIWDAHAWSERARIQPQGRLVRTMAMSPDGTWLVTADNDGIYIWDCATGKKRTHLENQTRVHAIAISPDGKWFVTASYDQGAGVWDSTTGRQLARLRAADAIQTIAISPDGAWFITADRQTGYLWDAGNWQERTRLQFRGWIRDVAISPDGTWLVTAGIGEQSDYKTARIWDSATGRQRFRLEHRGYIAEEVMAISPDGAWIVTSDNEATYVWDAATGRQRPHLIPPSRFVAISPDASWIVTVDDHVHIWDAATWSERARLEGGGVYHPVKISHDGKWLIAADFDGASIWDTVSGRERVRLQHAELIQSMALSQDGRWLAAMSGDQNIRIWNTITREELSHLRVTNPGDFMAISMDGRLLVTGRAWISIWDIIDRRERASFMLPGIAKSVATSPDAKWLLTTVEGQPRTPPPECDLKSLEERRNDERCAMDPDVSHWVRIWDIATAKQRDIELEDSPTGGAISPDGSWFVITSGDRTARIYDASTGRERLRLDLGNRISNVLISSDGKWLIGNSGHSTLIWDSSTGQQRANLEHQKSVTGIAVTADGKWLAATEDNAVHIWDLSSNSEYLRLHFSDRLVGIGFLSSQQLLAVAHGNSVTFEIWQAEDLMHDLCARMTRNLTLVEWKQYLGDEPYHRTCPNLPGSEPAKWAEPR